MSISFLACPFTNFFLLKVTKHLWFRIILRTFSFFSFFKIRCVCTRGTYIGHFFSPLFSVLFLFLFFQLFFYLRGDLRLLLSSKPQLVPGCSTVYCMNTSLSGVAIYTTHSLPVVLCNESRTHKCLTTLCSRRNGAGEAFLGGVCVKSWLVFRTRFPPSPQIGYHSDIVFDFPLTSFTQTQTVTLHYILPKMRPIALHGHSRAVTMVKYNCEGDLLFSTSKDMFPTVWSAETGERLGTYNGHTGAVWGLDNTASGLMLATAGADMTSRVWDVRTGVQLAKIAHDAPCRGVAWAHGDRHLACITDKVCTYDNRNYTKTTTTLQAMGQQAGISIYNVPAYDDITTNNCAYRPHTTLTQNAAVRHCVWGPSNDTLYFCCDDGAVVVYDVERQKEKCWTLAHDCEARRLSWDAESEMLLSAGWDKTAKLLDPRDVSVVKTYHSKYPVNDVCFAKNGVLDHVVLGGGVDAQHAALVRSAQNRFDITFHSKVHADHCASLSGHFGPVNALASEPNGHGFASGGEDGFVRLHHFDSDCRDKVPGHVLN